MYNLRGEIKSYIVREERTMEEVVTMLKEMYNRSGSVSNLSGKLNRGTLRYQEAKEIADVLDYDIIWVKRR